MILRCWCRATNSTAIEAIQTLLGFYATGRSAVMNAYRNYVSCQLACYWPALNIRKHRRQTTPPRLCDGNPNDFPQRSYVNITLRRSFLLVLASGITQPPRRHDTNMLIPRWRPLVLPSSSSTVFIVSEPVQETEHAPPVHA